MTPLLKMPFRTFFAADEKPSAFRDIVALCLTQRRALSFQFVLNDIVIKAEEDASTELRLAGSWTAPSLRPGPVNDIGVKLILPLLFSATKVQLPHDQIYTLGHSFRSVADFFARNLYLAIFRDVPIIFKKDTLDKSPAHHLRAFRRHYFYILKAEFSEACFQQRNAEDLLSFVMVNAYLPVLNFTNPVLHRGGEALRRRVCSESPNDLAPIKAELLETRAALMSQMTS